MFRRAGSDASPDGREACLNIACHDARCVPLALSTRNDDEAAGEPEKIAIFTSGGHLYADQRNRIAAEGPTADAPR
jgi:hypothetical protein